MFILGKIPGSEDDKTSEETRDDRTGGLEDETSEEGDDIIMSGEGDVMSAGGGGVDTCARARDGIDDDMSGGTWGAMNEENDMSIGGELLSMWLLIESSCTA